MLVVDDEKVIRKGIKDSIDWFQYGIEIVAEASNGEEALEKIKQYQPDIAVVDIKMPIMDGLECTKNIKINFPNTKVIILTGYDKFEYAKQAIRYQVEDFLLKPIGADELIHTVINLKDQIEKERKTKEQQRMNHHLINENLPILQVQFLNEIINKQITEEKNIITKSKQLKLNFNGPWYQIFILEIDNYYFMLDELPTSEKNIITQDMMTIIQEILDDYVEGTIFANDSNYIIGVINIKQSQMDIIDVCEEIKDTLYNCFKISVSIGVGKKYNKVTLMDQSYNEAFTALRKKVYIGKGKIIQFSNDDTAVKGFFLIQERNDYDKKMIEHVKSLEGEGINETIDLLIKDCIYRKLDYNTIKSMCLRIIYLGLNLLEEMELNYDKLTLKDPFTEINKLETVYDLKKWMKEVFEEIIQFIKENRKNTYNTIVTLAIDYMKEHYNENITLDTLANIVYVTPNYFSRVFKEETGENYKEYLTKYRVEQAKELLKNVRYKTYEVAEMVGYSNYRYFTHNFKKYEGCTPREFKKKSI